MHTFADLAKALNRSTVYLSGLQSRFDLPTFDGAGYSVGEDVLRVLNEYWKLYARISADVKAQLSQVRAAAAWAKRL